MTRTKGGPNKVGPNLYGVVDRPIASHEGFAYSSAMKDFSKGGSEKWTFDHLNHFLLAPKKQVPGTAMGFAGLPKETGPRQRDPLPAHAGRFAGSAAGSERAGHSDAVILHGLR